MMSCLQGTWSLSKRYSRARDGPHPMLIHTTGLIGLVLVQVNKVIGKLVVMASWWQAGGKLMVDKAVGSNTVTYGTTWMNETTSVMSSTIVLRSDRGGSTKVRFVVRP